MTMKHMPSGLFPHFDSAMERRPYFVRRGEQVTFGCRLEENRDTEVYMEITTSGGTRTIPGTPHSINDRGQRYFQFTIEAPAEDFSYRFLTTDGESSKIFSCPILTEQTLLPRCMEPRQGGFRLTYTTDVRDYSLDIQTGTRARIILSNNLTDKIDKNNRNSEDFECSKQIPLPIGKDGRYARLYPALTLLTARDGSVHTVRLRLELPGEAVYGLGEKFDRVNQRGKKPLNYVVEQFSHQEEKTYLPIPFLFTDGGVSLLSHSTYPSSFDLSIPAENGWIGMELFSCCPAQGELFRATLHRGTPAELLYAYATETGRPVLPPKWAFGPWISSNGWNTQREAEEQLARMEETGIPATVMVLEAWSDEETFYIWNDAVYTPRSDGGAIHYRDFSFSPEGKWPDPMAFCQKLEREGLKLILWQIPVIKYEAATHGQQLDNDWSMAVERGLCLREADGTPYQITEMWFGNSLIPDFTKPETKEWWLNCRRYLVEEMGVAGFKTDGGEFLFDPDACFADGRSVAEAHNDFPNLYQSVYHELLKDSGGITFSRAGYTGAQRYPIHWAGDQISTFSELRGQLTAGLSLGLSGVPFWGFDIGGFAGDFPTTELYLRSAAFAAFAPVMQFHSEPRGGQYYMVQRNHWNNDRSPWNMAEANRDERIIPIYRLFANLRMELLPYIWQEADHSSRTARPLMAHLIYDYAHDAVARQVEDAYMFGRDLLTAPVIEEGAMSRRVYLPHGSWWDFWTGARIEGGQTIEVDCPLEQIPVFVREGTALPVSLDKSLSVGTLRQQAGTLRRLGQEETLAFLLFGETGCRRYTDDDGTDVELRWEAAGEGVVGILKKSIMIFRMDGRDHGEISAALMGRTVRGVRKETPWSTM